MPTEKEVAENLELAMAKVPEALNDGDNSGNSGLEEIQAAQWKIHRELLEEIQEVSEMA